MWTSIKHTDKLVQANLIIIHILSHLASRISHLASRISHLANNSNYTSNEFRSVFQTSLAGFLSLP